MKKIILTVAPSVLTVDVINLVLAAVRPQEMISEKIYLKTLKGAISVCLS